MTEFSCFDRGMSCRSFFGGHHWGGEGESVKRCQGQLRDNHCCVLLPLLPARAGTCVWNMPSWPWLCLVSGWIPQGGFHSAGVPPASLRCPVPVTSGDWEARYWKGSKDQALSAPLRLKENPEFLQVFPSSLLLKRKHSYFLEKGLSDPHSKRKERGEGRERR